MEALLAKFNSLKTRHDQGDFEAIGLNGVLDVALTAIETLKAAKYEELGEVDGKTYYVFGIGDQLSRPVNHALFIHDAAVLEAKLKAVLASASAQDRKFTCAATELDSVLYSVVIGFACCIDLFKSSSRKTPGTFFELILGSFLEPIFPDFVRTKHIPLPGIEVEGVQEDDQSVATDIVVSPRSEQGVALVFPLKITTRERIVQPFAHQRILSSVYHDSTKRTFKSILIAVNEVQRKKRVGVNSICVPRTIILFQRHLAKMEALCYLDPPSRYLQADVIAAVPVMSVGTYFTSGALRQALS